MFTNFIYFIIAILICSTCQPSEQTNFTPSETVLLFLCLMAGFVAFVRFEFRRLEKQISTERFVYLDHRFTATVTRLSILALVLFAVNIYGLNLSSFLPGIFLFSVIPTLEAIVFLCLFVFYMCIIWAFSYDIYHMIYQTDLSRKAYVSSNVSFSIPVLLPWICLSVIADIIFALPFERLKALLATTEGEIVFFLMFLLAAAIFGPAMIQKFWRCRPLENGRIRDRIDQICRKAGVAYSNILYWPIFGGRMITAGVMGLVRHFRYILVTGGLVNLLQPEEIDAVIAHEIGHIKKKHLMLYMFFFIGYMFISYAVFDLILYAIIYLRPMYEFISRSGTNASTVTVIVFSSIILMTFIVYFRFVFGYFMRNFERQADTYVYSLFDSALPLITTLKKIAITSGQPISKPNWHHFSIKERMDYLIRCEVDRSWIRRHDLKIRKSLVIYTAAILMFGFIGWQLNFGEAGKQLNSHFIETIILRELKTHPTDANLYSTLGDLYYSRNRLELTIQAYQRSIELDPQNAQVLNNLAWLYATSPQPALKDPPKARQLAEHAIELKQEAFIYDTLAECYYINGEYDKAVKAASTALKLTKTNRQYYRDQLKKFETASASQSSE